MHLLCKLVGKITTIDDSKLFWGGPLLEVSAHIEGLKDACSSAAPQVKPHTATLQQQLPLSGAGKTTPVVASPGPRPTASGAQLRSP